MHAAGSQRHAPQLEDPSTIPPSSYPPPCGCPRSPHPAATGTPQLRPSNQVLAPAGPPTSATRTDHEVCLPGPQAQGPVYHDGSLAHLPTNPVLLRLSPLADPSPFYGPWQVHGWTHSPNAGTEELSGGPP